MIPRYLIAAAQDPELHGRHLRILLYLHKDLSPKVFTKVTNAAVANGLKTSSDVARRGIRLLVSRGYLLVGPMAGDPGRQVRTYRLLPPTQTPGTLRSPLRNAS